MSDASDAAVEGVERSGQAEGGVQSSEKETVVMVVDTGWPPADPPLQAQHLASRILNRGASSGLLHANVLNLLNSQTLRNVLQDVDRLAAEKITLISRHPLQPGQTAPIQRSTREPASSAGRSSILESASVLASGSSTPGAGDNLAPAGPGNGNPAPKIVSVATSPGVIARLSSRSKGPSSSAFVRRAPIERPRPEIVAHESAGGRPPAGASTRLLSPSAAAQLGRGDSASGETASRPRPNDNLPMPVHHVSLHQAIVGAAVLSFFENSDLITLLRSSPFLSKLDDGAFQLLVTTGAAIWASGERYP